MSEKPGISPYLEPIRDIMLRGDKHVGDDDGAIFSNFFIYSNFRGLKNLTINDLSDLNVALRKALEDSAFEEKTEALERKQAGLRKAMDVLLIWREALKATVDRIHTHLKEVLEK